MSFSFGGSKNKSSSSQTQTNPTAVAQYNSAKANLPTAYSPTSAAQISAYQNPFTDSVINGLQGDYAQTAAQQQNQVDDAAIAAGAFGGSRQAVQSGVTAAQGQKDLANLIAQLRAQGFSQALGAAQNENENANSYPLQLQALLGNLAANTTTNTTGTSKGSGTNFGLSYTYGGSK